MAFRKLGVSAGSQDRQHRPYVYMLVLARRIHSTSWLYRTLYPVRSRVYARFRLHFLHHVALWLIAIEVFFLLIDSGGAGVFEKGRHFA